jgi:hypothetical protein
MTFWSRDAVSRNKPSDGTVGTNTLILRDVLDGPPGKCGKSRFQRAKTKKAGKSRLSYQF